MAETHKCFGGCGLSITTVPAFNGLYCNDYCCACCPDKRVSPCQKEQVHGTMFDVLAKSQS
nr:hypothetical protein [Candidatus Sigynarchaeum springense]